MDATKGEYLKIYGDKELEDGNYVVMSREPISLMDSGDWLVREQLLTFSDIKIERVRVVYASDAKAKKGPEDSQEGFEEF